MDRADYPRFINQPEYRKHPWRQKWQDAIALHLRKGVAHGLEMHTCVGWLRAEPLTYTTFHRNDRTCEWYMFYEQRSRAPISGYNAINYPDHLKGAFRIRDPATYDLLYGFGP